MVQKLVLRQPLRLSPICFEAAGIRVFLCVRFSLNLPDCAGRGLHMGLRRSSAPITTPGEALHPLVKFGTILKEFLHRQKNETDAYGCFRRL